MPMRSKVFTFMLLAALAFGAAPLPVFAAEAKDDHAHGKAEPGSYEDWCGEHQVPESMCTRCNPELISAFKATNDWCPEHGLPESQCKLCNPKLTIDRPPRKDAK